MLGGRFSTEQSGFYGKNIFGPIISAEWTYTAIMDSSRVSTCLISMLLIVYGSFRSLNMEQEQREKEKKQQSESMNNLITGEPVQHESS